MDEGERLQKTLARAGYGSRRACEMLIVEGRVTIDGRVAELGNRVDPETQVICVDGKLAPTAQGKVYFLLNKPDGVVTTASDPQGRTTVLDLVESPVTDLSGRTPRHEHRRPLAAHERRAPGAPPDASQFGDSEGVPRPRRG